MPYSSTTRRADRLATSATTHLPHALRTGRPLAHMRRPSASKGYLAAARTRVSRVGVQGARPSAHRPEVFGPLLRLTYHLRHSCHMSPKPSKNPHPGASQPIPATYRGEPGTEPTETSRRPWGSLSPPIRSVHDVGDSSVHIDQTGCRERNRPETRRLFSRAEGHILMLNYLIRE